MGISWWASANWGTKLRLMLSSQEGTTQEGTRQEGEEVEGTLAPNRTLSKANLQAESPHPPRPLCHRQSAGHPRAGLGHGLRRLESSFVHGNPEFQPRNPVVANTDLELDSCLVCPQANKDQCPGTFSSSSSSTSSSTSSSSSSLNLLFLFLLLLPHALKSFPNPCKRMAGGCHLLSVPTTAAGPLRTRHPARPVGTPSVLSQSASLGPQALGSKL